jgi:molybdopterin-guanine dinucleotide biosynthesis protein B
MTPLLSIPVVAVVGSRRSGKTTATEAIVKGLTSKGYRVATAKHIHGPNFTIDTEGRDTWRHTKAGAHITIAVAAKELTTIRKTDTTKLSLSDITKNCEDNTDVIIIEGFRELVAQDPTVPKIVTVKNKNEIDEATQFFKPILAFAGEIPEAETGKQKIPIVNVTKQTGKLIELIDKRISPIIAKRRETTVSTTIEINGKPLPLNPYVQKVTRNVLLAILSTLKGADPKGNENVQIRITSSNKPTN